MEPNFFWKIIYIIYPPILRILEKIKIHKGRQNFSLGYLNKKYSILDLQKILLINGYNHSILAWKDTEEILNMRLVYEKKFQYHIRLFEDKEIRGHYEFVPEKYPLKHVLASHFENKNNYFEQLLGDFLIK